MYYIYKFIVIFNKYLLLLHKISCIFKITQFMFCKVLLKC